MIKRFLDLMISGLLLILLFIPFVGIGVIIKLTSPGPVFYWSDRVGRNNKIFKMCKFRTMRINTPAVATHLLTNADDYLTPIGSFFRKFSLDELPQVFNVIKEDMTFVGPRPALFNQDDLIELRTKKNVQSLIPGVTGWAQVNGRDDIPIPKKVELDEYYLNNKSLLLDAKITLLTLLKVIKREGVEH